MATVKINRTVTPVVIPPTASQRSWRGFLLLGNSCRASVLLNADDIHQQHQHLEEEDTIMTAAEHKRFMDANNGDEVKAMEQFQKYLEGRQDYQLTQRRLESFYRHLWNVDRDYYEWMVASETAKEVQKEAHVTIALPRIIRTHITKNGNTEARDLEGHRILHLMPAQIDDSICSLKTYALAIALYLDRKISRDSPEKVTILADVRSGRGWANPSALGMVPFIEELCSILLSLFPERMHKTIVYPLPYTLTWAFNKLVANILQPNTAKKLAILSGYSASDSPLPKQQLLKYVNEEVATLCEQERLAAFTS